MAGDVTERWLDIVSGKKTGAAASAQRFGLAVLSGVYRFGVAVRNATFDLGFRKPFQPEVPVISIGNITTGGTGKTPMVAWFVSQLQQMGSSPGILSRGYRPLKNDAGKPCANDEKLLLDQLCPRVPHVQNRSRKEGYEELRLKHDVDIIVLDDAFQHRQFHRNFDVVLIDATNPFGFDALLPRGQLREPIANLKRADCVIVTRANPLTDHDILLRSLNHHAPRITEIPMVAFQCHSLTNSNGEAKSTTDLANERVGAFCGIGNPSGFRETLSELGVQLQENGFRIFADHHHYSNEDAADLQQWAQSQNFTTVVTTQKDLVKINRPFLGPTPLWSVGIESKFLSGETFVQERLKRLVDK